MALIVGGFQHETNTLPARAVTGHSKTGGLAGAQFGAAIAAAVQGEHSGGRRSRRCMRSATIPWGSPGRSVALSAGHARRL
jgi:hypothetical protein